MASFNRIILIGNLTRDPEYKQLPSGQAVCRLGLASNRQFRNKQSGDMVQEVCYIDVDVWGAQAENCRQYLSKGRPVLVEGRIKYDSWQDQEGKTKSKHSIVADSVVFLSPGSAVSENQESYGAASSLQSGQDEIGEIEPRNEVERALKAQLDEIKNRKKDAALKSETKSANTKKKEDVSVSSEVAQAMKNDESPFDDLPF